MTLWKGIINFSKWILPQDFQKQSSRGILCKKGVLRNFTKFTGKQLCQSLFFNKVAGLRAATLLKKRLWHKCFSVNFVKFLRTPFSHLLLFVPLRLEGVETLKYCCAVNFPSEKLNIVSNGHGRTQKRHDFSVSVSKTILQTITDLIHDTIHCFRDSVLVCKMYDFYCTISKIFEHFYSLPSSDASDCSY